MEPNISQQSIVPPLIKEQLPAPPQSWVDLSMLVKVRGKSPAACVIVKVKYRALSDIDEEADATTTPVKGTRSA